MKTATLPLETAGPITLDEKRHAFLSLLAQSDLPLTKEESRFVMAMCGRLHFSTGEQAETDALWLKYVDQLYAAKARLPRRPTPHSALRTLHSPGSALRTPHFT